MMLLKKYNWISAAFTFSGTIIGAGVLGLPYALSRPGFIIGGIELIFLGFLNLLLSLMIGEISLRTRENHQIIGLANKYLGKKGLYLMSVIFLFSFYGALLAYLQGISDILYSLFFIPKFYTKLICILFFGLIVYLGLSLVKVVEAILVPLLLFFIFILSFFSLTKFSFENILYINLTNAFYPIGVLLFAFAGSGVIPEIKEISGNSKLKQSIYLGMSIPIFLYFFFCFSVLGFLGTSVNEIVTLSLRAYFGWIPYLIGNLFAIFAMSTSFLSLSTAIKRSYIEDFGLNNKVSFFLIFLPLSITFLNLFSFIDILSLTGGILMSLFFILSLIIFQKAKIFGDRKPEYSVNLPYYGIYLLFIFFIIIFLFYLEGAFNFLQ